MMGRTQFVLLCLLGLVSCCSSIISTAPAGPGVPSPGLYRCWSGGFAHLPAGTLTLAANGHYESDRPGGGGRYAFSPDTAAINFLDGDYQYWEYRGIFQRAAELRPSSGATDRIVLMPLGVTESIGAEPPGHYQYCYRDAAPH